MKQLTVTQADYEAMEKEVTSMTKKVEVMGKEVEAKDTLEVGKLLCIIVLIAVLNECHQHFTGNRRNYVCHLVHTPSKGVPSNEQERRRQPQSWQQHYAYVMGQSSAVRGDTFKHKQSSAMRGNTFKHHSMIAPGAMFRLLLYLGVLIRLTRL